MHPTTTRQYWIDTMLRIAMPVLLALAEERLKEIMPVEQEHPDCHRENYTYLEALGRTLMGIAPWLENRVGLSPDEEILRERTSQTARAAITHAVCPTSPDFMNFSEGMQPIVDAAFLCQGLLRAPCQLYEALDNDTKRALIHALKATRTRKPAPSNWLLFSAMIEAFLFKAGEADWDPMRIDYALRQHMQWYKGDGVYGDGSEFHCDYYNSFVIQPMLADVLEAVGDCYPDWAQLKPAVQKRFAHYATILENIIAPDGSYPVVGRSSTYRFGAFQVLAQAALSGSHEPCLSPAQIRCALSAVIRRVMDGEPFDENGWLRIGVYGHQPQLGEPYISTGSLYLCTAVFLPLGLAPSHPFWNDPDCDWTSKKIWSGGSATRYRNI
ncbi:MAG: DUF2264 domain-containing protein [Eubacteriales bacterium]